MAQRPPQPARQRQFIGGLALGVIALAACASTSTTGAGGRAGLVVRHGDGRLQTACVSFQGESISGEDLLAGSGFDRRLDAANALGSLICSIDGEGCAFPEEACLCRCDQPGSCGYWAYFVWDEQRGSWSYASQGARVRLLRDGDLDAWVWLTSTGPEAVEAALPEDVGFEEVCPEE
jgi:hypothetical protein